MLTTYQVQRATDENTITGFVQKAQANIQPPPFEPIGAFVYDEEAEELIGGVYGYLTPHWLYVDTLWVDENSRGQQLGKRLMATLEHAAVERGLTQAFLGTSDFQARPFYEKLGYQVTASYKIYGSHTNYLMEKKLNQATESDAEIAIQNPLSEESLEQLQEKLSDYKDGYVPKFESESLIVVAQNEQNEIVGGVQTTLMPHDLHISLVWVAEDVDAPNLIRDMVNCVEDIAHQQNVSHFFYRTDDEFLAEQFTALGYPIIGTVDHFPHDKPMVLFEK